MSPLRALLIGGAFALAGTGMVEAFVRAGLPPFGPIGWPGVAMLSAGVMWGAWSLGGGAAVTLAYYFLNAAHADRFPEFFAAVATRVSWFGGFIVLSAAALAVHRRLRRAENAAGLAAQLRLSEERLRVITDNTPALVSYIDGEERYRFNNRAYEDWLHVPRERLTGRTVREVWGEERYALMRPNIARALRGERVSLEYSMPEGGVERRILSTYVPDVDAGGTVKGFFVLGSDVTPLAAARAELGAARERLEKALDGSSVALWDADLRSDRVYLSEAWSQILGAPRAETVVSVDELRALVHAADLEATQRAQLEAMKGLRPAYAAEHRVRAADGSWRWILSRGRVTERDPATGRALRMIGTNLDITDRKRMEEALHSVAHSDPLTGLANRTLLMDRLRHASARSRRNGTRLALLYLDIDGFKGVNDRHGHLAGDALLKGFAQRLRTCVRATDTVARLGGDEFVVLLDELQDPGNAARVAEKILETVRAPIAADEREIAVTASIGVAHDEAEGDEERLLRRADAALYAAKAGGRNAFRIA